MVRGTFSPARAWRPAVVARLAQTLGVESRKPRMPVPRTTPSLLATCCSAPSRQCLASRRTPARSSLFGTGGVQASSRPRPPARTHCVPLFGQYSCSRPGAGRPSPGGRRARAASTRGTTGGSHEHCTAHARVKPRPSPVAARQSAARVHQAAEYGLPNPAFKRTAYGRRLTPR